jgi:hypothetical protein
MQKRYRYQDRHERSGESPFVHEPRPAKEWAEFVAGTSIRSLLRFPEELDVIRKQAVLYDDKGLDRERALASHQLTSSPAHQLSGARHLRSFT